MIVVAYLYNKNGMATWCLEASIALHNIGKNVLLIKSSEIDLPSDFPVRYINIDNKISPQRKKSSIKKIAIKLYKYYQLLPFTKNDDYFLAALHQHLNTQNIHPTCYLLNQTSFVNKAVPVPQYVVAWAYKPFLKSYVLKALVFSKGFKELYNNIFNAFYWHKTDQLGYKNATGVLAVSRKLADLLSKRKIAAQVVYPGTSTLLSTKKGNGHSDSNVIKFAIMALNLEDKRKGLKNIISSLKKIQPYNFEIILIGECSKKFKEWALAGNFPATFTGFLKREEAIELLDGCDVLLFGSLIDDWGYVQVEAMSRGMAVLSPNVSPFDEIVRLVDFLYDSKNKIDLEQKLKKIINSTASIEKTKREFSSIYSQLFSSESFAKNLEIAVTPKSCTKNLF